jgi:hypothetical protein
MPFQIVELELDDQENVVRRMSLPHPCATREEAELKTESAARSLHQAGYNAAQRCWWARDMNGQNYRFVVEAFGKTSDERPKLSFRRRGIWKLLGQ